MAILLLCAAVLVLCAVYCFAFEKRFVKRALHATGTVVRFVPLGGGGQPVAMVEFTDETGCTIQHSAQRFGARGVKTGDSVQLLYTHKKVMGLDAWNIFIVREGSRPFKIYTFAGVLLAVIAALMAAAAVAAGGMP